MIALESPSRLAVDDYLAFEQASKVRHELVDGYLYAMTGASDRHEEITANLLAILHGHLKGSGCRVYGSNLKLRVGDDFLYPDLFVRCATERGNPFFKTDPLLVVEVLSPSTRSYDRGNKRLAYQSLVSLQEYVLIAQDTPSVECYRRTADGWERAIGQGLNESLSLQSVALDIELSELYT
ncbi:MAG: Uma2 family endonuclease [Candidatus Thiosymbion ectosymbiont of Robbea hypermnestra]|nr:Uma2 family endonuclease [Candidatus Thiosymbion ectosymbiont of Robbea hypermnestra]